MKNNIHRGFKENIKYTLLFNQFHVANQLLKPLMWPIRLGDTKNPSIDQVINYVYKTDEHMEEHAPKINNTDTFPPEGHQATYLNKYYEVDQD